MTDEIDAVERASVEPTAEPACQPGRRKPRSEPRQVEEMNAATRCKRFDERLPPAPGAGKPVHEDNRFALAGDPILGQHSVDYELPNLHASQLWAVGRKVRAAQQAFRSEPGPMPRRPLRR
jgi:hypothetical protein